MKLSTKAKIAGAICVSASQNSAVLVMLSEEGSLISMINSVNAMAKTPSQKASNREVWFVSAME